MSVCECAPATFQRNATVHLPALGLNLPTDVCELEGGSYLIANSGGNNVVRVSSAPHAVGVLESDGMTSPVTLTVLVGGDVVVRSGGKHLDHGRLRVFKY